jgi:hypothetical protein
MTKNMEFLTEEQYNLIEILSHQKMDEFFNEREVWKEIKRLDSVKENLTNEINFLQEKLDNIETQLENAQRKYNEGVNYQNGAVSVLCILMDYIKNNEK